VSEVGKAKYTARLGVEILSFYCGSEKVNRNFRMQNWFTEVVLKKIHRKLSRQAASCRLLPGFVRQARLSRHNLVAKGATGLYLC